MLIDQRSHLDPSHMNVSQLDDIFYFSTMYILKAIYLNIIKIYVYLNKLGSIIC